MRHIETIAFEASETEIAQEARRALVEIYGDTAPDEADVIVALGGDGFMLQTLHGTMHLDAPVYGMNCGTIGFLMNEFAEEGLIERLRAAEEEVINPLAMEATCVDGAVHRALAINEVSLLRAGPQAAKLRISVDGKVRMDELVCDGALVCTPAGSTADPADRIRSAGPDRDGRVPATALAGRDPAQDSAGPVRGHGRGQAAGHGRCGRPLGPRCGDRRYPVGAEHRAPDPVRSGPRSRRAADARAIRLMAR